MEELPNFGLANTVTGFSTFFAGVTCVLYSRLVMTQPPRWKFAYWMVVITGVFTVTLHGFGETNPVWGARWFWAFLDTGSNIVVTWAFALAILADFYSRATRRWADPALTLAMLVGVGWHYYDRMPSTERHYMVPFGDWGGFYPGETWLILFSFLVTGLLIANRARIPARAMPLLWIVFVTFLCGMLLATASNDKILFPFLPLHALWHVVSAFGLVTLWAFNHVRFAAASEVKHDR